MSRPYPPEMSPQITNENVQIMRTGHLLVGMAAISEYALVEANVSLLLTAMARSDPKPIAAIYGELKQGHIQAKALKAVARVTLDEPDQLLLSKVMGIIKHASDARDRLSHRIWMYDDQHPNDVVLLNPETLWTTTVRVNSGGGPGPTTDENALEIQNVMRSGCQLWSVHELDAARIMSVHGVVALTAFRQMLEHPTSSPERSRERNKVENVIAMAQSTS